MVYNANKNGGVGIRTVNEVSKISGISVRTLHHYDKIGLLKPSTKTGAGYRLYDDKALERLHTILLLKELQFSLSEIKEILSSREFDPIKALEQQIKLLELKREHLSDLIIYARKIQTEGVLKMNFSKFDNKDYEEYAKEAKEKWGETNEFKDFEKRSKDSNFGQVNEGLMNIFAEFGAVKNKNPSSEKAQELVGKLQKFITDNYYNCSKEVLNGLGQMYTADQRFKENIDSKGGVGTAEFATKSIEIYCK